MTEEKIKMLIAEVEDGVSPGTTTLLTIELPWMLWTVDTFVLVKRWLLIQVHHIFKDTPIFELSNLSIKYEGCLMVVTSPLPPVIPRRIVFTAESLGLKTMNPMPCFTKGEIFHSPLLKKEIWSELVMSVLGLLRQQYLQLHHYQ